MAKTSKTPKTPKPPKTEPKAKAPPKAKAADKPAHYTASGNKKHQCNAPASWGPVLLAIARKEMGSTAREGDGVRLALHAGLQALAKRHDITIPKAPGIKPAADPRQVELGAVK